VLCDIIIAMRLLVGTGRNVIEEAIFAASTHADTQMILESTVGMMKHLEIRDDEYHASKT
jgi:hypothetical protein